LLFRDRVSIDMPSTGFPSTVNHSGHRVVVSSVAAGRIFNLA
jgi:hypothetical protein